ncbi:CGNR zinc finger domain-containing protein [Streptomyces mirabilis]|uniref:CGNR zinc finger domain-containing protein n=1 Tax=Streptomyces mirabilis TaxID=68239 RepID=UPI0037BDE215
MGSEQETANWKVPADAVVDFVNTRADGAGHIERFGSGADLLQWARERDLLDDGAAVTDFDVLAARELREALRTVLLSHTDGQQTAALADAHERLRAASDRYPVRAVVAAGRVRLVPVAGGVPGLLGTVLAAAAETAHRDEWALVKACSSPKCLYAFRDRTRNHSGRYCSPRCGSRMSMQALRERNKEDRA